MKGLKRVKKASLFVSLSLIFICALLICVPIAGAFEVEGINPLQTFDYMVLLDGQSATSSTSHTTPFGVHTVGVIAYGHSSLSATISVTGPSEAIGIAWVGLIGTGGRNWGDFAFGPVPNSGITASIDLGKYVSYALVTGGVFIFSPTVSGDDPARYSIAVR